MEDEIINTEHFKQWLLNHAEYFSLTAVSIAATGYKRNLYDFLYRKPYTTKLKKPVQAIAFFSKLGYIPMNNS